MEQKCIHKNSKRFVKPICAPPVKKKESSTLLYLLGALALLSAATIGYAKCDDNFRQNVLVASLPWTDNVIKFVFQEEEKEEPKPGDAKNQKKNK